MTAIVRLRSFLVFRYLSAPGEFFFDTGSKVGEDIATINCSEEGMCVHERHVEVHVVITLCDANSPESVHRYLFMNKNCTLNEGRLGSREPIGVDQQWLHTKT